MTSDDDGQEVETYLLSPEDRGIISAAIRLLGKVLASGLLPDREIEVIIELAAVLARMPVVSQESNAHVTISGPRRKYGGREIWHWWTVETSDHEVHIGAGGHLYQPGIGGDAFTTLQFFAVPGWEASLEDWSAEHEILDDAVPFDEEVARLDLRERGYSLEVRLDGEELSSSDGADENGGEDSGNHQGEVERGRTDAVDPEPLECPPAHLALGSRLTLAEDSLAREADLTRGRRLAQRLAAPPDACDVCAVGVDGLSYVVDGARSSQPVMWAWMCAACFLAVGQGIGWGKGQLYALQPDGRWLLVGGFQP